jgi:hypothetical protein
VYEIEEAYYIGGRFVECIHDEEIFRGQQNELLEDIVIGIRDENGFFSEAVQPKAQVGGQGFVGAAAEHVDRIGTAQVADSRVEVIFINRRD